LSSSSISSAKTVAFLNFVVEPDDQAPPGVNGGATPNHSSRLRSSIMAMLVSHSSPGVESAQVWRQLDTDRRQQAISVVAQMAFNVVKTQAASLQQEEANDNHATVCE
jgi:hypothetical protein